MKIRVAVPIPVAVALAATSALALAACTGQTTTTADSSHSPASSATSSAVVATSPAAPVAGEKPNTDFVVGKWGTNGDCALAIDLRPDGTSDGPFGNWLYSDGVISFADEPDFKVHVTVIDATTMQSTNDGKTAKMTRCP